MKHPFHQYIQQYTDISSEEWQAIAACLERTIYPKDSILLESGAICRKVYFLESGLLRYFVWRDGEEKTKYFTQPPYCFTAQRSLNQEIPSPDSIQALEDSVVWEMSRKDAFELFRYPGWSEFVRLLVQEVQFFTEQILEALQTETAESRYIRMIEEANPLLQKVPLKYIASYLGIAPQSLSRIRKRYLAAQADDRS
ncbi:MAG: Crp/Fnr family transcriptional regulator [Bacteroidota bacterium]